MTRPYQRGFYRLSEAVRDPHSRRKQADKIVSALKKHSHTPLAEAACLDVGCSSGIITYAIAPLVRTMLGLDYDEIALAAIPSGLQNPPVFIRGDGMRLPVADASMDVLVCAQVYEHVPDADELFAEMARVLKPGGTVFFSGPNWLYPIEPHYLLPFLHWLPSRLADAWLRRRGQGDHYYERSQPLWKLRGMLQAFEIKDITQDAVVSMIGAGKRGLAMEIASRLPVVFWRVVLPFLPNFNWILYKRP